MRCVRPNGGAFARGRAGYLTATGTLRKEQHMAQVVRDVMTSDPVSLAPDASATEAGRLMRDQDTGAILVADGELRGIVTDRDIVVRAVAEGADPAKCRIG